MPTQTKTYRFDAYHVLPDSPQMQRDFLVAIASLEAQCEQDAFSADVLRVARLNAILPMSVSGFQYFAGRGLGGLVQLPKEDRPRPILIGRREFIAESGLQLPDILEVTARKWEKEPNTVIALAGWDGWVRGVIKFVKS